MSLTQLINKPAAKNQNAPKKLEVSQQDLIKVRPKSVTKKVRASSSQRFQMREDHRINPVLTGHTVTTHLMRKYALPLKSLQHLLAKKRSEKIGCEWKNLEK